MCLGGLGCQRCNGLLLGLGGFRFNRAELGRLLLGFGLELEVVSELLEFGFNLNGSIQIKSHTNARR